MERKDWEINELSLFFCFNFLWCNLLPSSMDVAAFELGIPFSFKSCFVPF